MTDFAGTGIRLAITRDVYLKELVESILVSATNTKELYYAFFYDFEGETWDFWTTDTPVNTATNVYYSLSELEALLEILNV